MRAAVFTLFCFVASGYAAKSQKFSLLPQVGFENSKTFINYNNLGKFSPEGVKFSPQASLRLNYSSRQGHGFFVGAATSRSVVSFSFADPEAGMHDFTTSSDNLQLRLEGGYQFNSKPIMLHKTKQPVANNKTAANSSKGKGSSFYGRSCCHRNNSSTSKSRAKSSPCGNKGSWVRIQPSVGLGFIPAVKSDVITKTQNGQSLYEYRAGNWNTALIAGAGFEFGRKSTKLFTVSINYFKGIGNLGEETITSSAGGKSITTKLQSSVAGWNMRVGIPFSLKGQSPAAKRGKKWCREAHQGCRQARSYHF